MNEVKDAARNLVAALKTERDELRVQLSLASVELRDKAETEIRKLDSKWAEIRGRAKQMGREVETISSVVEDDLEDITDNVAESSKAILDEIRAGYKRIRDSLK